MKANYNDLSLWITELQKISERLLDTYSHREPKFLKGRLTELLDLIDSQYDSLIKNDRASLILLQRLQSTVGNLIQEAPNVLYHHGLLEICVKLSPNPTMLTHAISIGLFQLMQGRPAEQQLIKLGLDAVRLGGMYGKPLAIARDAYGLTKDCSPAFVPWKSPTAKQRNMALVANEMFSRLFVNTVEHGYALEPKTLELNLQQILCGLAYFGGEIGCQSIVEFAPTYVKYRGYRGGYKQQTDLSESPVEAQVAGVLAELFVTIESSNVLYAMKDYDYQGYVELCESFNVLYQAGNSLKSGAVDFDCTVLPADSAVVKESIIKSVNECFNGSKIIDVPEGLKLLKVLRHFGLKGAELRTAVTNTHVSNMTQWVLDICLTVMEGRPPLDVTPRDAIAQVVKFGAEGPAIFSAFMAEHQNTCEGLIEFLKEEGSIVGRNALVMGQVFKDEGVKAVIESPVAMGYVSAATMYHYAMDAGATVGHSRESFSRLEIAGIAGKISKYYEGKESNAWGFRFADDLSEVLARCAQHPVTKDSMSILTPDQIKLFQREFKEWFTEDYKKTIIFTDHRFRARQLENDIGL